MTREILNADGEAATALNVGDRVKVRGTSVQADIPSTPETIYMNVEHLVGDVPVGATILIADGEMELHVEAKNDAELTCRVMRDCTLRSRKSVNVPNVSIALPSVAPLWLKQSSKQWPRTPICDSKSPVKFIGSTLSQTAAPLPSNHLSKNTLPLTSATIPLLPTQNFNSADLCEPSFSTSSRSVATISWTEFSINVDLPE